MVVIIFFGGCEIIKRNPDWKSDFTLYSKDIKAVPNSLLVNANLGVAYVNQADFEKDSTIKAADLYKGIILLNKAIELHNACLPAYINRGLAWFRLGQPDSAQVNYDKLYSLIPGYSQLPNLYYNLGVFYFLHQRFPEAKKDWERTLQLNPNYGMARNALEVLAHQTSAPQ
jgi:tetratricopeptide (TPR) repeat protein